MASITLTATLDRKPNDDYMQRLLQKHAGTLLSVGIDGDRLSAITSTDAEDDIEALRSFRDWLIATLVADGYTVRSWEAAEVLSSEEVLRRLATPTIPPMVSAAELAEMCGVSTQRIYELETERRKAAEQGREHPLPTPVVPGWWLRSAAQQYAANRKRKPGPPRRAAS